MIIPIAKNKGTFQLRQSCRDSIDRKLDSINSIQPNLRSSNRGAFTRSNVPLFFAIGIKTILSSIVFPLLLQASIIAQPEDKIASCQIMGGLGNQLFQVANVLAFAWDNGYTPIFPKIDKAISRVAPRPVYWDSVFYRLNTYPPENESIFHFSPSEDLFFYNKVLPEANHVQFFGYFQDLKYFDHHREKIWEAFRLPPEMEQSVNQKYREIIEAENDNTVAIHIRLDDTFSHPVPSVIDLWTEPYASYYDQAIALFPEDMTFVIFSDNSEWSREFMKKKLEGRRAVYVTGNDYLDLHLMGLCKHIIIANSTYSWWGAYLNRNPDKIVIAPKNWMKKGYEQHTICPSDWIIIDNFDEFVP